MNEPVANSRREFIKTAGAVLDAAVIASVLPERATAGNSAVGAASRVASDEGVRQGDTPNGDKDIFVLGRLSVDAHPNGIVGYFHREGRVVFREKPRNPWEFMATGTGVTGLTVTVDRNLRVMLNHASAFDELGMQRILGVLKIDYTGGSPFLVNESFRMEHDLRQSRIELEAKTKLGQVVSRIWAHPELDVIAIEIVTRYANPQTETMWMSISKDYPHEEEMAEGGIHLSWHVNRSSVEPEANRWSGIDKDAGRDPLLGRCFGTAIFVECEKDERKPDTGYNLAPVSLEPRWNAGVFSADACKRCVIWITAESTLEGQPAWRATVLEKLKQARSRGLAGFVESHENWWNSFWKRSLFEPADKDGRFLRQKASFDLYRYYVACSSGARRETPLRFLNDLFHYSEDQHIWSLMDITAVETYQKICGALRTGDVDAIAGRVHFYARTLPLLMEQSRARFHHQGGVSAYETNPWGVRLYWRGQPTNYTEELNPWTRYSWSGNIWMIYLMCDYIALSGDSAFAHRGLRDYATQVFRFFREHYPDRDGRGFAVFFPSSSGESWIRVRNSTELICALKATLPRLVTLAEQRGWDQTLVKEWRNLLRAVPPLPKGSVVVDAKTKRGEIAPGDLLVPAEDMSQADPARWINRQHAELFPVWPAKLVLRSTADLEVARRTFAARNWKHLDVGWALDVVFAACLGLVDEVQSWYDHHFEMTHVFPCGLAQEASPKQPDCPPISIYPSMQGLGTSVIPVVEQLIQDYPDLVRILSCWPRDVGVQYRLFSPHAGWVTVVYQPDSSLEVETEKKIDVELPDWVSANPRIKVRMKYAA